MSVNPGFGGQSFIQNTLAKTRVLKQLILAKQSHCQIEIDGGVTLQNAKEILAAGADVLVAGSSIFNADHPIQAANELKSISFNTLEA
jgi:ribulose-phosphate 3-epimerase